MVIFLTSSTGKLVKTERGYKPAPFYHINHFLENVEKHWEKLCHVTIIASDPDNTAMNDSMLECMKESLKESKLSFFNMHIVDHRNSHDIQRYIDTAEVLILAGGHVPTQHKFFEEIQLSKHLKGFQGIIIGISAGSMNCCKDVYAIPELEGEAKDESYVRYFEGLGLCKETIIPHYQRIKDETVDGIKVSDMCLEDSYHHPFIALEDGSYIMIENNITRLYGNAYIFNKGECEKICKERKSMVL